MTDKKIERMPKSDYAMTAIEIERAHFPTVKRKCNGTWSKTFTRFRGIAVKVVY